MCVYSVFVMCETVYSIAFIIMQCSMLGAELLFLRILHLLFLLRECVTSYVLPAKTRASEGDQTL